MALVAVVAFFTHPSWLGVALRPLAGRYGVAFEKYERVGQDRFALLGVSYARGPISARVDRVEGFLPLVWRRQAASAGSNAPIFLEITGWKVDIGRPEKDQSTNRPPPEVYPAFKKLEAELVKVRKWLPRASMQNGLVSAGGREYRVGNLTWQHGKLEADGAWPGTAAPFSLKADVDGQGPYQISYAINDLDLRFRLRAFETNNGLRLLAHGNYEENRAELKAQFARQGTLPETADLTASDLRIKGEKIGLPEIETIEGSLKLHWETNGFTTSVQGQGQPAAEFAGKIPELEVNLEASGDTNKVLVSQCVVVTPALQVKVTEPFWISTRGAILSSNITADVAAQLEKLPWIKSSGKLQGKLLIAPGERWPVAELVINGEALRYRETTAQRAELQGRLDWPLLSGLKARVEFDSNSVLSLTAGGNLQQRVLENLSVQATGKVAVALLPGNISYDHLRLAATASGPISNLQHRAEFQIAGLKLPGVNPVQFEGAWHGHHLTFTNAGFRARSGPATLVVELDSTASPEGTNFVIQNIALFKGDEPYLTSSLPAQINLRASGRGGGLEAALTNLALTGSERRIEASGHYAPGAFALTLAATNIHPELFQSFSERSLRGLKLYQLAATLHWTEGLAPLQGEAGGLVELEEQHLQTIRARFQVKAARDGIEVERLAASTGGELFMEADGFIPVAIHPAAPEKLRWDQQAAIDFRARSRPNKSLWNVISNLTGVVLANPVIALEITNRLSNPLGGLELSAEELHYTRSDRELPRISDIKVDLGLNEKKLLVRQLSFRAEDQPVAITGESELGENFWTSRREEIKNWLLHHSRLRVQAPKIESAALVRFFPKYLAPGGTISVDAGITPGMNFEGGIQVSEFSSRPLPHVGVVSKIGGEIGLSNRLVELRGLSADLGGQTLRVGGTVDLRQELLDLGQPGIDLAIRGENLPLARNLDVILRSDLDLQVKSQTSGPPMITGLAVLRESLLMKDIAALAPGRIATARRRPPFFSIEVDPLDEWRLDVRVRGDHFMRVRSPFFSGTASANFVVQGTAQEPSALGEVTLPEGAIIFPFARLHVRQGLVSMTADNPYTPQVFVVAAGRAFGFDITMQVEGSANEPEVTFTSVPSLTSEEIVLMLTTGNIPRSDFGYSNEQRASKLAMFLGKNLWSKFKGGSADEERLTIRSGEDVSVEGRQTYAVEYKLSDRWALVGEYDRFGALNAGVKWKIYTR